MNLSQSSPIDSDGQAIKELLLFASEFERKFALGRASDISPEFVQKVIQKAITARKTTKDRLLIRLLANIEDVAYAILASEKTPNYYQYLRELAHLLQDLAQFR